MPVNIVYSYVTLNITCAVERYLVLVCFNLDITVKKKRFLKQNIINTIVFTK